MVRDFLDINNINEQLTNNKDFFVAQNEKKYRDQLIKLVNKIASSRVKMILLAGPTCAGKTTTAKLLQQLLEEKGYKVIAVSMDDFFLNYKDTPNLPNGTKDLDSLRAINLDQMEECFHTLFEKGEAMFPHYDFLTGMNNSNVYHLTFDDKTIIIFEGLHTHNPDLIKHLGTDKYFKVYASALSGFKFGDKTMTTRELRLLRRTVRDMEKRGYDPMATLSMWTNVVDSEDKYITPFKDSADAYINTTHAMEVAIYRDYFLNLMENYPQALEHMPFYDIVKESVSLDKNCLPDTSLMWEFVVKHNKHLK